MSPAFSKATDHHRWIKVLPKKDQKFQDFVNRVRETPAGPLAQTYSPLCQRLVAWLLECLDNSTAQASTTASSTPRIGLSNSPAQSQQNENPMSPPRYEAVPHLYTDAADFDTYLDPYSDVQYR